jgi:glycosyltransferase involved in cell wall biosynthesis
MPDPIRVLYLDHTAKLSGGEIALLRLLQALDRAKVEPIVLLGEDGPLVPKMREAGIETHVVELDPDVREIRKGTLSAAGIRHLLRLPRLLNYSRRVARFASDREADLIHTNSLKSDIYGVLAARMARVPVVWHVHDILSPPYLPNAAAVVFRNLAGRLPDHVIVNSHSTLESLRRDRVQSTTVVYNGVEMNLPTRGKARGRGADEVSGRGPVVGIVGRIAPWKGQDVFLQAAEIVLKRGYPARFWIIGSALFGEAEFEQKLRQMAEGPDLQDSVSFLGFREDIQDVLQQIDILVHASTVPEPFGQVIIEGMAAGLPVIASDAGGPQEIITHGLNGFLTPPGDAKALAEAIIELLENQERAAAIAEAGRDHVAQHFSVRASAEKVERIYRDIITNRSHRSGARGRRSAGKNSDRPQ